MWPLNYHAVVPSQRVAGGYSSWAQPMPGGKACSLGTAWDSWAGSAAHLCAPLPQAAYSRGSRGPWMVSWPSTIPRVIGGVGCWGGGRGEGLSNSQKLFISSSSPPPSCFLQTVSVNKAINTQEVAVKEKHARNILLAWILGRPTLEGGQMVGTEVRRRLLAQQQEE